MARAVVLMHGLFRTGASMLPMEWYLRKNGGYTKVLTPTTGYHLHELPDSAEKLSEKLHALHDEFGAVDVVTHSTGGLLARAVMPLAPLRRVVMLAPPNQGTQAAELARDMVPVHRYLGWDPLAKLLPGAPVALPEGPAEIGIITGGTGDEKGFIPLLDGDNDQTVRVEEARLDSAVAFRVVPVRHTWLMAHPDVQAMTLNFLDHGQFDVPA
jgi:triacylglycerol lipase